MDLSGKVATVTGSGLGLGLAYATALARLGAAVVVNDVDEAAAEAAAKTVSAVGGPAVAEVVPVGTAEAAQALVDRAVREFGRVDILVNNAGILRDTVLWKMTDEQGEGGRIICVGSPPGKSATSGRQITPRQRPASWERSAPGPWSWPRPELRSTPSFRSRLQG